GKASDRAGAQIVAVGEAARDDDGVDALQVAVAVPQDHRLADALTGVLGVDLVAGAREAHHPKLHAVSASTISKSSISGLVSSRRHISGSCSASSRSSSIIRPTATLRTPWNPSAGS